jgi:dihydroorotase
VHAAVVASGQLDWADVARVLSGKPAEIGSLAGYSTPFAAGSAANFTLYDPSASRTFATSDLRGKGINSPYLGRELPGRVIATVHNGRATVLDGELVDADTVAREALNG